MANTEHSEPIVYCGQYQPAVDESRRVMIPVKWRPKEATMQFTIILWPIAVEDYLLVLPPERWNVLLENLKKLSLSNEKAAALERVIGSTSDRLNLDDAGRLRIPEKFASTVGIEKEAALVGRIDKFEIWNPARCAVARPSDKKLAAGLFKKVHL